MSTTCVYSDIVLPTATWYEKNDLRFLLSNYCRREPQGQETSACDDLEWHYIAPGKSMQNGFVESLSGRL